MNLSAVPDLASPLLWGALLAVLLLGLLVLVVMRRGAAAPRKDTGTRRLDAVDTVIGWPPEATRVLTRVEARTMQLLREALPDHVVLAQVPVSRFVTVPKRHSFSEWMRRIGQVTVDFLVCDERGHVIAAVELRQPEVAESDRARRRHARMDRVLRTAGIAVHVWREGALPDAMLARDMILATPGALQQGDHAAAVRTLEKHLDDAPEVAEMRDPPPSTWFDEFGGTQPAPLDEAPIKR